jgi:CRISPR-associated endoribonuclease Cas6
MDLIGIRFQLQVNTQTDLMSNYGVRLHAWFLNEVRKNDPKLSKKWHDNQLEKNFTLSRLQELDFDSKNGLRLMANNLYSWIITGLNAEVVQWLQQWLNAPPTEIKLGEIALTVVSCQVVYPLVTYQSLLTTPIESSLSLTFSSPTSFRRKKHHFPLPLPYNVFQSYLRRWNNFANYPIDSDIFLQWIDDHVLIARHQIETVKVLGGKRGKVTGFIGTVEYGLSTEGRKNEEFTQLFFALGRLAPYCGTGHKMTFGLGQTRYGWLLDFQFNQVQETKVSLTQEIDNITNILMGFQKRKGGERGLKVCQTRATIFVRQNRGESLKEIAEELKIPYETVKTYAKIARKLLNQTNS